jgi:hypothetical protein
MDTCRFDNWTRKFGDLRTRRAAVGHLAAVGAAFVGLARLEMGLADAAQVGVEDCKLTDAECTTKSQCCSNICAGFHKEQCKRRKNGKKKRNCGKKVGTCRCARAGQTCSRSAGCCNGYCDPNRSICACVPNGDLCNEDDDCCSPRVCRPESSGSDRKVCRNN